MRKRGTEEEEGAHKATCRKEEIKGRMLVGVTVIEKRTIIKQFHKKNERKKGRNVLIIYVFHPVPLRTETITKTRCTSSQKIAMQQEEMQLL